MSNSNLHGAKRAKNDEFYTQISDIEKELRHYKKHFRGKVVFCNCDDPDASHFWKYFSLNFEALGLKRLVATHFDPERPTYVQELVRVKGGEPEFFRSDLKQNGDFRSPECVALLKQADIVVTNPPFSLFREYVAQLVEHGKGFVILGSNNAITYKEIFPLIQSGLMWLGTKSGDMAFKVPDHYPEKETRFWVDDSGQKWRSLGNICWFTNLDHLKRHEELILYRTYKGNEDQYPTYDNYDAIEVSKTKDIPMDYDGVMGVPITFLDKHNPEQFEIVGCSYNYGRPEGWDDSIKMSVSIKGKHVYKRILIRRKT